jgi:hypothetical protein
VALDGQPTQPTAAEFIKNILYVDDLPTGADTASKTIQLYEDVTSLLKSGKFIIGSGDPTIQISLRQFRPHFRRSSGLAVFLAKRVQ